MYVYICLYLPTAIHTFTEDSMQSSSSPQAVLVTQVSYIIKASSSIRNGNNILYVTTDGVLLSSIVILIIKLKA